MKTRASALFVSSFVVSAAACVPPGNSTPSDAGAAASGSAAATRDPSAFVPSVGIMTAPFEDTFDRKPATAATVGPSGATGDAASTTGSAAASTDPTVNSTVGTAHSTVRTVVDDAGNRHFLRIDASTATVAAASSMGADVQPDAAAATEANAVNELGPDWNPTDPSAWHLEHGKLCGSHARNHGVWLNKVLPINARIEFDAIAETEDGDLKGEFWGDGRSFATSLSYTNATGYLAIMGGWHNTFDVIARHNEHGTDRKELKIDKTSDDPAEKPVEPGQTYRFKVERTDGKTVKFAVNNIDLLSYADMDPIKGAGHDHFAFNDWDAKVCFDNLKITPLP